MTARLCCSRTVSRKCYQPNCRRCELWSHCIPKVYTWPGARKRWQCHWYWVCCERKCWFGSSIIRRLLVQFENNSGAQVISLVSPYWLVHLMAGACRPLVRTLAKCERFFGLRSFNLSSWIFYFSVLHLYTPFHFGSVFSDKKRDKTKREKSKQKLCNKHRTSLMQKSQRQPYLPSTPPASNK